MRWNFTSAEEGFVFSEVLGSTTGYHSTGRLYMNGGGSWGRAHWRIEFPRGVYSVSGTSTVSLSPNYPGNCFVEPSIWDWYGNRTYSTFYQGEDPATHTATESEEIRYIGVECNIYNNGFYAEWIEIDGFTGLADSIPGYPSSNDIYTSATQLGSVATEGIFTNGVQFDDQSTSDIFVNNTRLDNG